MVLVAKVDNVEIVGRVSANGRIVIPKDIRDLLNIEDGDFVRLVITEVIKVPKSAKNGSNKKRKK
ncbi:AbrB/MazE/SpoVT family DNA-binding domain-containing protein [Thermococcus sp.]|uniref:AbrB/MazE/SpoVT family DNA-binding domain-containing protein n=1 Tax=Thermococcus sp. TaxID=35749 RepID=UPI002633D6B6|nr:AbrB/MazE/SpoVT family DNA-binding domain-containing protein [Thermococcus sp.]